MSESSILKEFETRLLVRYPTLKTEIHKTKIYISLPPRRYPYKYYKFFVPHYSKVIGMYVWTGIGNHIEIVCKRYLKPEYEDFLTNVQKVFPEIEKEELFRLSTRDYNKYCRIIAENAKHYIVDLLESEPVPADFEKLGDYILQVYDVQEAQIRLSESQIMSTLDYPKFIDEMDTLMNYQLSTESLIADARKKAVKWLD